MIRPISNDQARELHPGRASHVADIVGMKYFKLMKDVLPRLHSHKDCHNRKLHYDEFVSLLLLHFFNPTVTSLRSIQKVSGLKKVQEQLGIKRTSLGSLSEASRVFDPSLLAQVFSELAGRAAASDSPKRPSTLRDDLKLIAVDGTLLRALPRMVWALWLDDEHRSAKLHVQFNVLTSVPERAALTDGNTAEKEVLRKRLEPNTLYVLDRHYMDYGLFSDIRQAGSSFVCRVRTNAVYQTVEERAVSDEDRAAGVVFDREVRLGHSAKHRRASGRVRVIQIHVEASSSRERWHPRSAMARRKPNEYRPEDHDLLIVTDQMELSAADVGLIYRRRWTVETFFRWFKCVLGFSHLFFESQQGLEIMVYCGLIGSLLIAMLTGRKPTKRTFEMVQFYIQGWANEEELLAHIAELQKKG